MTEWRLTTVAVSAPKHLLNEFVDEDAPDEFAQSANKRQIAARQSEYHHRRFDRETTTRKDAFAEATDDSAATSGDGEVSSYADAMRLAALEREEQRVRREIERQRQEGTLETTAQSALPEGDKTPTGPSRWDDDDSDAKMVTAGDKTPTRGDWDEDAKPAAAVAPVEDAQPKKKRSRWDETPAQAAAVAPAPKKSRWDQAPAGATADDGSQPIKLEFGKVIPGAENMMRMLAGPSADPRNRYMSDEELDALLPSEGYDIVQPPPGYEQVRTPAQKLQETPISQNGFIMQEEGSGIAAAMLGNQQSLPNIEDRKSVV